MTDRRLRVGIIGTGWVAMARHIPSFRRHPAAEVVAVYDRNEARARDAAGKMRIARSFSRLEAFFDQGLDIVSICTPPWTHTELAVASFERGLHVFTEKPMGMNEAEATAMVDASVKAGRLLCVSHNFLFSRTMRRADRLARTIGRPRYVLGLQLSSPRRRLPTWYRELPAGLIFDESPHMLYTLQHFLGPLELDGARAIGEDPRLPETVEVLFRGSRGPGQVGMQLQAPVSEWHVMVVGRDGVLDLDLFRDILIHLPSDAEHGPADVVRTSASALFGHALGFGTSGARYAAKRLFWGHEVLIRRFVDAVLAGGRAPVDPAESVAVVRLMDSILAELRLT